MERSEVKIWSLLHAPTGPIAIYIDAIARDLLEQGFTRRSIAPQVRLIAKFSGWLETNAITLTSLSDEHVGVFMRAVERPQSKRIGDRPCLQRLMCFLRSSNLIQQPAINNSVDASAIQQAMFNYGASLLKDQALSRSTCAQYISFAEHFLSERFGSGVLNFDELRAADVVEFIRRQASRYSPARAKSATIALRSFLRYLRMRGAVSLNLAAAVPTVPNWSMTGIPRAISQDHVEAVLASCRRDTAVGCRDYAILLLLSRLGLRSSEIVALTLDSIDWEQGSLAVVGSKGGQRSELPLPADVGSAIVEYLQRGRPRSACRSLFLRVNAPIAGLGSQTSIGSIVVAAIARAGIHPPHAGAHQFRHALACQLLRQGASLTEIGSLLRHQHQKTTSIYAKVDFTALRSISLAWPGSAQ